MLWLLASLLVLQALFSQPSFASAGKTADLLVFAGKTDKGQSHKGSLRSYFENSQSFLYFESEAPTLNQSLFYKGLSPRNLELKYNGFELRDSSNPDGVLSPLVLSQLKRFNIQKSLSALDMNSQMKEGRQLSFSVSSLEELNTELSYGVCKKQSCTLFDLGFLKQGGVSQLEGGSEKDFSQGGIFSFSHISHKNSWRSGSHLFLTLRENEDDDLFSLTDDPDAEANQATLFFGQELKKKSLSLRASFMTIYREQINIMDALNPTEYDFEQKSNQLSIEVQMKNFNLKAFRENFRLENQNEKDISLEASGEYKNLKKIKLAYSSERDWYGELRFSFYNVKFIYKKILPSLFQLLDQNFGNEDLNTEELVGMSFQKNWNLSEKSQVFLDASYYRQWQLIEFFDPDGFGGADPGSYQNVSRAENLYLALKYDLALSKSRLQTYLTHIRAKNLVTNQDLPRRPDFVLGVTYESKISKNHSLIARIERLGNRKSFSGEELDHVFFSSLKWLGTFDRGSFQVEMANLNNEDRVVFQGIGRREFRIKLGVDLNF